MAIIIYYLITYDFNTIALLYYFCNFATGNAIFSIHDRTSKSFVSLARLYT